MKYGGQFPGGKAFILSPAAAECVAKIGISHTKTVGNRDYGGGKSWLNPLIQTDIHALACIGVEKYKTVKCIG